MLKILFGGKFVWQLLGGLAGRAGAGHTSPMLGGEMSEAFTLPDASELCCTVQYIHSTNAVLGNSMATTKTTTLTFRIEPGLKEALRMAAEQEHRSIANMVEVMIRAHCQRAGIVIIGSDDQPMGKKSPAAPKK